MGTMSHVEFWLDENNSVDGRNDRQAQVLIELVEQEMFRIDRQMSPYKKESELSLVNRVAAVKVVPISNELFSLLKTAQHISKISDGSFDITYASIGYQYNYRIFGFVIPKLLSLTPGRTAIFFRLLLEFPKIA